MVNHWHAQSFGKTEVRVLIPFKCQKDPTSANKVLNHAIYVLHFFEVSRVAKLTHIFLALLGFLLALAFGLFGVFLVLSKDFFLVVVIKAFSLGRNVVG